MNICIRRPRSYLVAGSAYHDLEEVVIVVVCTGWAVGCGQDKHKRGHARLSGRHDHMAICNFTASVFMHLGTTSSRPGYLKDLASEENAAAIQLEM